MPKFLVTVVRSVCTRLDIEIEADNREQVSHKALEKAAYLDFSNGRKCDPEYSVDGIYPLNPIAPEDKYPIEDWKYEVQNGDTKLGYAEWVEHKKESDSD